MVCGSPYCRLVVLGSLVFSVLGITDAYAQFWESMGGPGGSYLGPAVVCPNGDLYITSEGIFRSRDNGTTWQHVGTGIQLGTWRSVGCTPSGTICILSNGELLRSQDDGATWEKIRSFFYLAKTTFTPRGEIYVVSNDTLYHSTDEGAMWSFAVLLPELKGGYIYSDHDNVIYVVAPANNTAYRSSDNGVTWEQVEGLTWGAPWFTSIKSGFVMAAVRTELYSSSDSGKVWKSLDFPGDSYIMSIYCIGDTIFVADGNGIQKTTDGKQWEPYPVGYPPNVYSSSTFMATEEHLFYWSPFELSRYDRKTGWRTIAPPTGMVHLLAATTNGGVVAATKNTKGTGSLGMKVWATNDSLLWQNVFDEQGLSALSADSSGQVSVVTMYGLYKHASDSLTTWETGARFSGSLFHSTLTKDIQYVISQNKKFYRSSDHGATWDSLSSPPTLALTAIASADPGPVYVAGDKVFYRSSDLGQTWEEPVLPFISESGPTRAIVAHDSVVIVAVNMTGVYFSSDHGTRWVNRSAGLPSEEVRSLVHTPNGALFLATSSGVYEYQYATRSWSAIIDTISRITILCLAVGKDGRLYAGTDGDGVYRSVQRYDKASLAQAAAHDAAVSVYPNPATSTLRIAFGGDRPVNFEVSVYSLLGGKILSSQDQQEIDVGSLPIGMYFLRLSDGQKRTTQPFIIQR